MMQAVELKQPIHLIRFKSLVAQLNIPHRLEASDIRGIKIKGDLYQIEYIHPTIEKEIQNLVSNMGHDRMSAAKQNLSHQHKVIGSYILIRQLSEHPQVVIFEQDGRYQTPVKLSRYAVIVENRQVFLNSEKFIHFLKNHTHVPCDQPLDFIFGTGNEIANSLHQNFLNQYEHLYLCFDCDYGGLKIAKNLFQLLPDKTMTFVQPHDIQQRLNQVVHALSSDEIEKLAHFAVDAPIFIRPFAQLLCSTQRRLEQESFLYDQ